MRLLNRRNMRINLAKRTARKRYLVYTTDDFGKPAVDPTRVFASPQPQNRHFRGPVEKVGLRRNSGWTTTKGAAGKAGITMSPWWAWPMPSCCWSSGALKKLQLRLCLKRGDVYKMVLIRMFGVCPICRRLTARGS